MGISSVTDRASSSRNSSIDMTHAPNHANTRLAYSQPSVSMVRGARHVFAARMNTAVGTVFIASAAASGPRWVSYPPEIIGFGGRDEYGPYGALLSEHHAKK
jgi:hypothetical protein